MSVNLLLWVFYVIVVMSFTAFGVNLQAAFLLFGPPGCGKTLIAKAVAHEAGANFIHIKVVDVWIFHIFTSAFQSYTK